jgi:hypothetical protein
MFTISYPFSDALIFILSCGEPNAAEGDLEAAGVDIGVRLYGIMLITLSRVTC